MEIVEIIDSNNCHTAYIDLQLNAYQNQPLLMIAYSHGLEHSLRCKNAGYISSHNIHLLFNALFYTNACLVATVLGKEFDAKQGAFIGFSKKVRAFHNDISLMKVSVDCDNCGLKYLFCHPKASVGDTYRKMKAFYNQVIDKYTDLSYNIVTIQTLRRTMNSLKIYGNVNLNLQDYINKNNQL